MSYVCNIIYDLIAFIWLYEIPTVNSRHFTYYPALLSKNAFVSHSSREIMVIEIAVRMNKKATAAIVCLGETEVRAEKVQICALLDSEFIAVMMDVIDDV